MKQNLGRYRERAANAAFGGVVLLSDKPNDQVVAARQDAMIHLACRAKHSPESPVWLAMSPDMVEVVREDVLRVAATIRANQEDNRQVLLVMPDAQANPLRLSFQAQASADHSGPVHRRNVKIVSRKAINRGGAAAEDFHPDKTAVVLFEGVCHLTNATRGALNRFINEADGLVIGLAPETEAGNESFVNNWGRPANVTDQGKRVVYQHERDFRVRDRLLYLHESVFAREFGLSGDVEDRYDDAGCLSQNMLARLSRTFQIWNLRVAAKSSKRGNDEFYPAGQMSRYATVDEHGFLHLGGEVYGTLQGIQKYMNAHRPEGDSDLEFSSVRRMILDGFSKLPGDTPLAQPLDVSGSSKIKVYPLSVVRSFLGDHSDRLPLDFSENT